MMPKLNYDALRNAVNQINDAISNSTADCTCLSTDDKEEVTIPDLPATLPSDDKEATDYRQLEEGVLEALHKVVFDLHVMNGCLLCPDTGRKFPISDGIPNMILHEDEIERKKHRKINDAISNSTADCTCLSTDDKEEVTIPDLPATLPSDDKEATDYRQLEEGVLEALHKVVFDLHVMNGYLLCPDTGRKFPVSDGIPNMILHEDEI
eukprot:CAMPEP_0194446822 /NCGR_PEP_ID=MMETSP0176-20130528/128661_1 /TAXON_ID=216777 /ORGANISM="Proboscia alata, Strain PI-D3" /LENGTH=207 /DNA_ID=CAMNT_0039273593 /DNA_START=1198 /DNA_END=1822 /DNA_ORIENTATION=+